MDLDVRNWGGGVQTRAGGTRTGLKLARPWQVEISFSGECPFETKPQKVLAEMNGWELLENLYTPFSNHLLIIPERCWEVDKLRRLGGAEEIEKAMNLALSIIKEAGGEEVWLGIHIGPTAGQNLLHPHWHLLRPIRSGRTDPTENQISLPLTDPDLIIFEKSGMIVSVGGVRAGQCFITPRKESTANVNSGFSGRIISIVLDRLISLCATKFKNPRELPPEYMVWFVFRDGKFKFGSYLPILNFPGITESMAALFPNEHPNILPWTHKETARHLRG